MDKKIDKELPPGYKEKFSFLTHQLFFDIFQLIEKYMKNFEEIDKESHIPYTIAINALSRMISVVILEIPREDTINKQEIIKYFQKLAHEALDGNLKIMMKIKDKEDRHDMET